MDDTRAPAGTAVERCPSCSSRVGPRELWCSLCHTALASSPAAQAPDTQPRGGPADDPADDALPAGDASAAPPSGAQPPELDAEVVEAMLAELAGSAQSPALRGLASRQTRVLVAAGGGVVLTVLLLLVMTVLGAILG